MKAAINTHYGPPEVVQVRDTPKPAPGANEVLVRVCATTVNRTDCGMRTPYPFFARAFIGLFKPKVHILGLDFAGTIEAVGDKVTAYEPGDKVFGLSPSVYGAHAEYLVCPEGGPMALMPDGVSFTAAAPLEGAWYANGILRAFDIRPGQSILIYGTSGAIGTAAVQLAKSYGARVTAVCPGKHVELAKSLGADHIVDLDREDFAESGETFDFVLDAVGKVSYFRCRKLLTPDGVFSATDLGAWGHVALLAIWSAITSRKRVVLPTPKASKAIVEFLKALIEKGEYHPVIDRRYPLDEIVDAYRYVETGQKVGNVVIDVMPNE